MKSKLLFLIILIPNTIFCQNYDVRKTRWGMSIKEVENSEYPFKGEIEKSISGGNSEIWFDAIDFGSINRKATVGYIFNPLNELDEVRFIIRKNPSDSKEFYSLSLRIRILLPFIESFKNKGYIMHSNGWQAPYGINYQILDCIPKNKQTLMDSELDQMYKCAIVKNKYYNTIDLPFLSERTIARLAFPINIDEKAYENIIGWVIFKAKANNSNTAF